MNKVRQADLGTPASSSANTVKIEIDGLSAIVKAGTSILRALDGQPETVRLLPHVPRRSRRTQWLPGLVYDAD